MSDWVGFTDAELNKIKNNKSGQSKPEDRPKIVKPVARKAFDPKSKQTNRKQTRKQAAPVKSTLSNLPPSALLSKPVVKKAEANPVVTEDCKQTAVSEPGTSNEPVNEPQTPITQNQNEEKPELVPEEKVVITDDQMVQEKEKQKLEDVHRLQQEMEEKNRRKKAMLTKEIALRKKKALAESSKLQKLQVELAKLDQLLSCDVSILRDKIDEACYDYNSAKKRFEQAEGEYIAAKIDLHKKTILKEDLTEHLYHLIEANEQRKSKKLEELMLALDVEEEELLQKEKPDKSETPTQQKDNGCITNADKLLSQENVSTTTEASEKTSTESLHGANTENCKS